MPASKRADRSRPELPRPKVDRANKAALLRRLSRIEGQVRGVAQMIEDDRYCIDVLTQLAAIRSALDAAALGLTEDHVRHKVKGRSFPKLNFLILIILFFMNLNFYF